MVPTDEERDAFALDFHQLALIWDALSPDPILTPFESDYRWLAQVYESLKPPSGNGKLLWHALGSKTIELIHRNVRVIEIQDDIEIVLSPEVVAELEKDPDRGSAAVEFKLSARLRSHSSDPEFVALSERLEQLRQKHQDGVLASVEFLRSLIELARDIVEKERNTPIEVVQGRGRAALTDLFNEIKDKKTPIIVERVVSDIDDIVQKVRFENWQKTEAGEREVKQALRRTLLKYKLHNEQNIFDRAYEYIFQYY
jgi:type I restriction enzyme R subunit